MTVSKPFISSCKCMITIFSRKLFSFYKWIYNIDKFLQESSIMLQFFEISFKCWRFLDMIHAYLWRSFSKSCTDSNDSLRVRNGDETMSMLRELPGAELTRINPEDLDFSSPLSAWPGNFPFNGDVSVSYSHDEVNDINNINATNYTFQWTSFILS